MCNKNNVSPLWSPWIIVIKLYDFIRWWKNRKESLVKIFMIMASCNDLYESNKENFEILQNMFSICLFSFFLQYTIFHHSKENLMNKNGHSILLQILYSFPYCMKISLKKIYCHNIFVFLFVVEKETKKSFKILLTKWNIYKRCWKNNNNASRIDTHFKS